MSNLQKIRSTLITAEYVILDATLTELNIIIGQILNALFQEPITVTLRSLRQVKKDERIKPEINLEITYKGSEFGSLSELSGGEKAKVSLSLMIAFSRCSRAPFVLLDESLSSLDVVTKEAAVEVLKQYLGAKLALVVNHDTTEDIYSSVIKLD